MFAAFFNSPKRTTLLRERPLSCLTAADRDGVSGAGLHAHAPLAAGRRHVLEVDTAVAAGEQRARQPLVSRRPRLAPALAQAVPAQVPLAGINWKIVSTYAPKRKRLTRG
eukprot:9154379-Pyramimonas_sp.AAC.1